MRTPFRRFERNPSLVSRFLLPDAEGDMRTGETSAGRNSAWARLAGLEERTCLLVRQTEEMANRWPISYRTPYRTRVSSELPARKPEGSARFSAQNPSIFAATSVLPTERGSDPHPNQPLPVTILAGLRTTPIPTKTLCARAQAFHEVPSGEGRSRSHSSRFEGRTKTSCAGRSLRDKACCPIAMVSRAGAAGGARGTARSRYPS